MRLLHHLRGNAVAYLALMVALGGTSYAAISLPKNSVGNKQLKSSAVTSSKVKDHSLLSKDFKSGQLPKGAKGDKGDTGAQGPVGPSTGPAGGDLSGSYPNPAIAAGAVGPSKLGKVPTVRLYRSAASQAVTNDTNVNVSWDGEESDPFNMHDATNPTRVTAPISGEYLVTGNVSWTTNTTGTRIARIQPSNRGGDWVGTSYVQAVNVETVNSISSVVPLSAGDYIEFSTFQNSGSTLNITALGNTPNTSTNLQMTWIAPLP